jgi:4-oxalocrotonate tautomerase
MPFVRIDLMRGKSIEYRKTIGDIVYNAMRDVIDVPKDDTRLDRLGIARRRRA